MSKKTSLWLPALSMAVGIGMLFGASAAHAGTDNLKDCEYVVNKGFTQFFKRQEDAYSVILKKLNNNNPKPTPDQKTKLQALTKDNGNLKKDGSDLMKTYKSEYNAAKDNAGKLKACNKVYDTLGPWNGKAGDHKFAVEQI